MSQIDDKGKCWLKTNQKKTKTVCLLENQGYLTKRAKSVRASLQQNRLRNRLDVVFSLPPKDKSEPNDKEVIVKRDKIKSQKPQDSNFSNYDLRNCFSILSSERAKPFASAILIANNAILTVHHFRKSNLYRSNFWKTCNELNANARKLFTCQPTNLPLRIKNEDLEILILAKPIINIEPATLATKQEIDRANTGLIVSYGIDENGVSGVKRERVVDIELPANNSNYIRYNCSSKRHLIVKAPAQRQVISNRIETDGINPRDSGCPLYINCNGIIKLAGIATKSLENGEVGLFIRVDTYQKEIKKILARFPS